VETPLHHHLGILRNMETSLDETSPKPCHLDRSRSASSTCAAEKPAVLCRDTEAAGTNRSSFASTHPQLRLAASSPRSDEQKTVRLNAAHNVPTGLPCSAIGVLDTQHANACDACRRPYQQVARKLQRRASVSG
jgi:hypothetical protein